MRLVICRWDSFILARNQVGNHYAIVEIVPSSRLSATNLTACLRVPI
jgi:hypothetical protein